MGAAKDDTSAILPYVMLAGIAAVIYVKRDAIAAWLRGLLPGKDDIGAGIEDTIGVVPGSITGENGVSKDVQCRERYGSSFIWNPWRGQCVNGWTGETAPETIDTPIPGTTPGEIPGVPIINIPPEDLCNWEPWKSSTACQSSKEPITTPGYNEALEGVDNYVSGDAAAAYANAQAIRAAAAAPPASGWNFQTIRPLIEADGYTEFNLSPTLALGINAYGWDVHYTQDSGPWHEGQIISMTSGGNNPFGGGAFDAYLNQAMAYGGV